MPPGTIVPLRITETLGSDLNEPGDVFSATVTRAVYSNGSLGWSDLVVAKGARVTGEVVRAEGGDPPVLALELRTIETMHGIVPLHGVVVGGVPARIEATAPVRTTAAASEPGGEVAEDPSARRIWLLAGTALQVELTAPIAAR